MDYSLLVGIHNLDKTTKDKNEKPRHLALPQRDNCDANEESSTRRNMNSDGGGATGAINRNSTAYRSINRHRLVAHSTAMESIQAECEPIDDQDDVPPGGIPARSEKGERLLLFVGIIDILQSYRLKKKLEHTFKSIIHDGETVSVCRPSFYAQRFQNFMAKTVFRKIPSLDLPEIKGNHRKFRTLVSSYIALKHSPSKRKSLSKAIQRSLDSENENRSSSSHNPKTNAPSKKAPATRSSETVTEHSSASVVSSDHQRLAVSGSSSGGNVKQKIPPPVPPRSPRKKKNNESRESIQMLYSTGPTPSSSSTPPPAFDDISSDSYNTKTFASIDNNSRQHHERKMNIGPAYRASNKEDAISISEIHLDDCSAIESFTNSQYGSRGGLAWTPPAAREESTPTWTEGTPSFTDSSSSGDFDCSSINFSKIDHYRSSVQEALNSLSSEIVQSKMQKGKIHNF